MITLQAENETWTLVWTLKLHLLESHFPTFKAWLDALPAKLVENTWIVKFRMAPPNVFIINRGKPTNGSLTFSVFHHLDINRQLFWSKSRSSSSSSPSSLLLSAMSTRSAPIKIMLHSCQFLKIWLAHSNSSMMMAIFGHEDLIYEAIAWWSKWTRSKCKMNIISLKILNQILSLSNMDWSWAFLTVEPAIFDESHSIICRYMHMYTNAWLSLKIMVIFARAQKRLNVS